MAGEECAMDDLVYGERDKRGDWKPNKLIEYPPVFVWPPQPVRFLKWFVGNPGFGLPWNLTFLAVSVLVWLYLTPPMQTMKTLALGWVAFLLFRNAAIATLFYGAFHLRLYTLRRQGTSFKFNAKWPSKNKAFLFGDQTAENIVYTLASAVPIWTAYEVLTLWAFANNYIPFIQFNEHPVYFVVLLLLVPLFRDLHFYAVHRMLHWPFFYRAAHKLHHKYINPGPWSGLAMHPVEHVMYFSCVLVHWIVPSHPVHALFNLAHAALSPAPGHTGFDKVLLGEEAVDTESYAHYLHHKYFECNYADGVVPLDKWFGTFHDGSAEAHERMSKRLKARAEKRAAQAAGSAKYNSD
jgi:sterol desaturase/sphingolipid hydroxylase (fatty acid hydroxylase superfamily)